MFNSKVSDFFKNIKKYREDVDDNFEVPSIMLPTLRSYQRKAVKWMNTCEKDDKCELITMYIDYIYKIYLYLYISLGFVSEVKFIIIIIF